MHCVCAKLLHSHPILCNTMGCSPPGSSVHGDSLGKNTGVGCHFLLQGIFPTQGSNPWPTVVEVWSPNHWTTKKFPVLLLSPVPSNKYLLKEQALTSLTNSPSNPLFVEEGVATHSSILGWTIPMDRGAWGAIVHEVTKSQTRLRD